VTTPNPRIGYVLVVAAALMFGVNAGFSRIPIEAGLDIATYTTVRITGAFFVFLVAAAALRPSALKLPDPATLVPILMLGLFGVALLQWTYNAAVVRLPLGIALLLEYLAPVLVVLWVRFARREQVHPRMWPAIGLALMGLGLVGEVWKGLTLDRVGVLAALASGTLFAMYFLLGERITATGSTRSDPLQTMVWAFGAAAIFMNLLHPAWNASALGNDASMLGNLGDTTIPAWLAMTYVVVVGTVLPFFLYLASMQHLPSSVASVVAMLEPVIAVFVGWLWFAELLSAVQALGVVVVLTGIILAQTARLVPADELPPPV
jgi:drug/metabolite transporter (DMT)-like permease